MGLLFLIPIHTPTSMESNLWPPILYGIPTKSGPNKDVTRGLTHR